MMSDPETATTLACVKSTGGKRRERNLSLRPTTDGADAHPQQFSAPGPSQSSRDEGQAAEGLALFSLLLPPQAVAGWFSGCAKPISLKLCP